MTVQILIVPHCSPFSTDRLDVIPPSKTITGDPSNLHCHSLHTLCHPTLCHPTDPSLLCAPLFGGQTIQLSGDDSRAAEKLP
jgi:hypothetical protein